MSVDRYVKVEARAVLDGERLLPPRALCERWGISKRTLQTWVAGDRRDGLVLKAFRPSERITRFRVRDVLDQNFASLAFNTEGMGSYTFSLLGTKQNDARTGFLPLDETVRVTSRMEKDYAAWEGVKIVELGNRPMS